MTVFNTNFSFMDSPGGETEDVFAMKQAGFSGMFCNVHAYEPEQWDILRAKCISHGMFCGPWARMGHGKGTFSLSTLNFLIAVADEWKAPLIVNAENELTDSGSTLTTIIAEAVGSRDAAISMEPWLFNPPSVDWTPIGHLPMLLQIFPAEQVTTKTELQRQQCKEHAWDCGIKCVYFTFGTYSGMKPEDFTRQEPYSLFTGNQVGARQEWDKWKPTSSGFKACKEVIPVPPKPVQEPWYSKPYPKGKAVGPAHLPREIKPPSKNGGVVMSGPDCLAMKRIASKAQRWMPWAPSQWDNRYNEQIAMGKGTGLVGDTGMRGIQRQEGHTQDGIVDDEWYQVLRKIRIPTGPNQGDPIIDSTCVKLFAQAAYEFSEDAKLDKIREAMRDFILIAEANEAVWHYTQARPFTGIGADPATTHFNDCSSYVILVYYAARKATGISIPDPSGYRYGGYGNTWDDLDGHSRVTSGNYLIGDLAHYDGHVTICKKGGSADTSQWSSFGQEAGPNEEKLYYRPDFIKVVRPKLLV